MDEPPGRGAGVVKDAAVRGVAGSGGEEEAFVIVIGAIVVIGHGGPGPGAGVVKDAAVGGVAVSGGEGGPRNCHWRRRCQGYYHAHTSSSSIPLHFDRQETTVLWC